VGDAFAPPQDTDSLREITRELSRLVGRDRARRFIRGVIDEAGVELSPAEGVLLARAEDGSIPASALVAANPAHGPRLREGLERLSARGLAEGTTAPCPLTPSGAEIRQRLLIARQRSLRSLVADWEPEDPRVDAMIARLAAELARSERAA
jgi:hypothetical protein